MDIFTRTVKLCTVCVSCVLQEGPADLVPLEDEWKERRRIHMTSIVGGFKGMRVPSRYPCV